MKRPLFPFPMLIALAAACGGSQTPVEEPSAAEPAMDESEGDAMADETTASEAAPSGFAEQVALGQTLYGERCAECHGDSGQGGDAPAVVGLNSGALPLDPPEGAKYRTGQFKTVADIATFVVANMPPGEGGSLSAEEYWSILAFDLKANGIELEQKLTPELAATLEVPR